MVTSSCLITSGTDARHWILAGEVLEFSRQRGVVLDGIARSATVASFAAGLLWQSALEQAMLALFNGISGAVISTLLGSCTSNWKARGPSSLSLMISMRFLFITAR